MAISCITATAVTPTCTEPVAVTPTCISATVLGPNMVITDSLGNVVSFAAVLGLALGVHVFTISNSGEGRLHILEITIDDATFSVTQPADRDLEPGETTTFSVTVPA